MEGPHYIITSVNQLENQSEFWPQENMEEIIMIRLPSKPNHYIQTMILPTCVHFKWITGPCAMCVLVTLRVFGVIRKLQLWFITLCIMLHIALVGVIIITPGVRDCFANITPGLPGRKTICEYSLSNLQLDLSSSSQSSKDPPLLPLSSLRN